MRPKNKINGAIPKLTDIISSNLVNWKRFVRLQDLTDESSISIKDCIKAYRMLESCIHKLVETGILSPDNRKAYSIFRGERPKNGKIPSNRIDPRLYDEFYAFRIRSDAENYMDELKRDSKKKFYIYEWQESFS